MSTPAPFTFRVPSSEPIVPMDIPSSEPSGHDSFYLADELDHSIIYNLDDDYPIGGASEVVNIPPPLAPRIVTPRPSRKKVSLSIDDLKQRLEAKIMNSTQERNHLADAINSTVLNAFNHLSEDNQFILMTETCNLVNEFLKANKN